MITNSTEIYCTLQAEGTHNWPDCPFDDVKYLTLPHRHIFHIKAYKYVSHDDRDIEFIRLKHQIRTYVHNQFYQHNTKLCEFGAMSCEMIGQQLMDEFDLSKVDVSEDGENGAIVHWNHEVKCKDE